MSEAPERLSQCASVGTPPFRKARRKYGVVLLWLDHQFFEASAQPQARQTSLAHSVLAGTLGRLDSVKLLFSMRSFITPIARARLPLAPSTSSAQGVPFRISLTPES